MLPDSVVFLIVFAALAGLYFLGRELTRRERARKEHERRLRARDRYEEIFRSPYDQEADNVVDLDSRR